MRSYVEALDGNKVKLSVEVDEAEFDAALNAAFRKIARDVRVPGFRPGKAPRRLIEARLGPLVARQEALREALPEYYERALQDNDITPVSSPEIDITAGQDEGPVAFDAIVEVMPEVSVAGYEGLRVVLPNLEVTDADVDQQVDQLREQFGELRAVSRPARDGDHVSIDRKVTHHDQTLQAAEDELYEVGKGTIVPELDAELRGKRAGDILKFNAKMPAGEAGAEGTAAPQEATFTVLVKEVRETVLPDVTDEWASEASEFETVAELREDIRRRMEMVRQVQASLMVRDRVLEALVELVDEEMPAALVQAELERRIEMFQNRMSQQGVSLQQYLEITGRTDQDLLADLQAQAVAALKADVALKEVADLEGIEVSDEEVEADIAEIADRRRESPEAVRHELQSAGELPAVRSSLRKNKALEWLAQHTEYVDEDGRPIDRSQLEPATRAASGPDSPSEAAGAGTEPAEETAP
ncbi:MAG: trigger factor [Actinomycetota bacterium]|nr:trigger factor [Actinomycetota bacterium]